MRKVDRLKTVSANIIRQHHLQNTLIRIFPKSLLLETFVDAAQRSDRANDAAVFIPESFQHRCRYY